MITPNLYTKAAEIAAADDPYPMLAGMADFMLPYTGRLTRLMAKPEFAESDYLRTVVRDLADEYTFTGEYLTAKLAYARMAKPWTNEEADAIGAAYLRAYRDMVPATAEDVPF